MEKNIDYPDLYIQYGSNEPFFLKEDAEFLKSKYKELNQFIEIEEFNGGHDYQRWNEGFAKTISKLLSAE